LGDFLKLFRHKKNVFAIQPRTSSNTQERFWTDLKQMLMMMMMIMMVVVVPRQTI